MSGLGCRRLGNELEFSQVEQITEFRNIDDRIWGEKREKSLKTYNVTS